MLRAVQRASIFQDQPILAKVIRNSVTSILMDAKTVIAGCIDCFNEQRNHSVNGGRGSSCGARFIGVDHSIRVTRATGLV